ncbi:hypothetical protein Hamer_G008980 [Homarus americanus]|uniref:Uncharacterized protein n=1 Tax=Homarus americanus TaxID=6706 RepID=A0A8J5MNW5_HOMAM|nr:hypothetical protein Hamer_G008980 [Homarus americanus]
MVECWDEVTPATVNHAWRNVLEGMPEDRQQEVPGEPQSVQAEVELAAEEASMWQNEAEDIMEEDRQAEEDRQNREDSQEAQPAAQHMSKVRKIIELSELLKHLIEQHPPPAGDSESVSSIIGRALQPYVDQLNQHHNALRQRQIMDFFRQQQQPPQPPVIPQADFEGFSRG